MRKSLRACPEQDLEKEEQKPTGTAKHDDSHNESSDDKKPRVSSQDEEREPSSTELGDKLGHFSLDDSDDNEPQISSAHFDFVLRPEDELLDYSMFFINEFKAMRNYIQGIWKKYIEGTLDLNTVSNVTNMAIEMMRSSVQEQVRNKTSFENAPSEEDWIDWVYERLCPGIDLNHRKSKEEFFNYKTAEQADLGSYPVSESFKRLMRIEKFQLWELDWMDESDITEAPEGEDNIHARYTQDEKIIQRLWLILNTGFRLQVIFPAQDGLTRIIHEKHACSEKTPLELVFTMQVYLDIFHITQLDHSKASRELSATGQRVRTIASSYLWQNSTAELRRINDPKFELTNIKIVPRWIDLVSEYVEKDPIKKAVSELKNKQPPDTQKRFLENYMKDNLLYRIHPLLCGTLDYWFKINVHFNAIVCSNYYDSILAAAHLYNAARQSNLLKTKWQDMEYLIEKHTAENIFQTRPIVRNDNTPWRGLENVKVWRWTREADFDDLLRLKDDSWLGLKTLEEVLTSPFGVPEAFRGERPTTPRDFWERVKRMKRRKEDLDRNLREIPPVHAIFFDVDKPVRSPLPRPKIEYSKVVAALQDHIPKATINIDKFGKPGTAVNMLELISVLLSFNCVDVNFDYHAMHQSCARLLSRIHQSFIERMKDTYFNNEYDKKLMETWSEDWLLLGVPEYIFVLHPEVEKISGKLADDTEYHSRYCRQLRRCGVSLAKASDIMANVIKNEGSVNIDKAKEGWSTAQCEKWEAEGLDMIHRLIE